MIGNNSCGVRSIMAQFYGPGPRMSDNVHELDVLLYDGTRLQVGKTGDEELERIVGEGGRRGEIYTRLRDLRDRYADQIRERYPDIPRRVSGYNLDDLLPERGFDVAAALTGTEGTCAMVLEATVHLLHAPPHRSLLVLGYEDEYEAADHVCEVLDAKPLGCEGLDAVLLEDMKVVGIHDEYLTMLPDGHGFLLVEFGGETKDEADEKAHKLMAQLKKGKGAPTDMKLYDDKEQEAHVWEVREAASAPPLSSPVSRTPTRAGRIRRYRRSSSAATSASSASSRGSTATRARSTATTATAACTRAGTST